jgi:selenium metabolism protein YedF
LSRIFNLDLTSLPYPQPVLKIQAVLKEGRRGPLTVSLADATSATAVAAPLNAAGMDTRTYRQDERWLVLGREGETPEILVWHGPGGWQAALDDQTETEDEAIIDLGPPLSPWQSAPSPAPPRPGPEPDQPAVVLAGSRSMGAGDDVLGVRLTAAFFEALAGENPPPRLMAFYNTGVFLTTRDSAVVEALRDMAGRGASVISSGLCLAHFGLKDQLKVGRIGHIYEIVKAQAGAARVIRL